MHSSQGDENDDDPGYPGEYQLPGTEIDMPEHEGHDYTGATICGLLAVWSIVTCWGYVEVVIRIGSWFHR